MGQLIDLTTFNKQIEGEVGKRARQRGAGDHHRTARSTRSRGSSCAAFWYVWRDVFEKNKVKLPTTFEEAKAAAAGADPAQGQLLRHGPELEPHGRRLRRHAEPDVLLRRRAGRTRTASTSRSRIPKMQTVMKWATDIYKDKPAAGRHAHLDRLGQQRELHRQEHRADLQRPAASPSPWRTRWPRPPTPRTRRCSEEALANHVALPHPAGPDGRRMQAICDELRHLQEQQGPRGGHEPHRPPRSRPRRRCWS